MDNKLELNIQDVGDCVHDALAAEFDRAYDNVKFDETYVPYGDTQVVGPRYVDEDDEVRIREEFQDRYDFESVMKLLKDNPYFKRAILDMVEYVAWNREA